MTDTTTGQDDAGASGWPCRWPARSSGTWPSSTARASARCSCAAPTSTPARSSRCSSRAGTPSRRSARPARSGPRRCGPRNAGKAGTSRTNPSSTPTRPPTTSGGGSTQRAEAQQLRDQAADAPGRTPPTWTSSSPSWTTKSPAPGMRGKVLPARPAAAAPLHPAPPGRPGPAPPQGQPPDGRQDLHRARTARRSGRRCSSR